MTNYTYQASFGLKDNLDSGNSEKVISGADFDVEFNALEVAVSSKADQTTVTALQTEVDALETTVNSLDNYSTGEFTPILKDSVAAEGGNTASTLESVGRYVKNGRMVHATIMMRGIDTTGLTSTAQAVIHDLPFTAYDGGTTTGVLYWIGTMFTMRSTGAANTGAGPWVPVIQDGYDYLRIFASNTATATFPDSFLVSDLTDDQAGLWINIVYEASE